MATLIREECCTLKALPRKAVIVAAVVAVMAVSNVLLAADNETGNDVQSVANTGGEANAPKSKHPIKRALSETTRRVVNAIIKAKQTTESVTKAAVRKVTEGVMTIGEKVQNGATAAVKDVGDGVITTGKIVKQGIEWLLLTNCTKNSGSTDEPSDSDYESREEETDSNTRVTDGPETQIGNGSSSQPAQPEQSVILRLLNRIAKEQAVLVIKNHIQQTLRMVGISTGEAAFPGGVWLEGARTNARQDHRSSDSGHALAGATIDSNLMTVGWDQAIALTQRPDDTLMIGAALTLGNTMIHTQGSDDTDQIKNYTLSVYSQWQYGQWSTEAILGIGVNQHHKQQHALPSQPLTADYNSQYLSLRLLEGYDITRGCWLIKPLLGLHYTQVHVDGYRKQDPSNSSLTTVIDKSHYRTVEVGAGWAVQPSFSLAGGQLIPTVQWLLWYGVDSQPVKTTARSLTGAHVWTVNTAKPPRMAWEADLHLRYVRNNSTVEAGYTRNQEPNFHSDNYYLQFKYDF